MVLGNGNCGQHYVNHASVLLHIYFTPPVPGCWEEIRDKLLSEASQAYYLPASWIYSCCDII